jgi:sugar lactone lactonase YvrE
MRERTMSERGRLVDGPATLGEGTRSLRGAAAGMLALAVACASLTAGCGQTVQQAGPAVFFPPAPAPPRIQYLKSYTGVDDIEEQSEFNRFVVGEKQNRSVDKPYGVGMFDGKIYVCDTNATVAVFDLGEKTFGYLKGAQGQGVLRQPVNITITPDGTKYVSDPVRGQVIAYGRDDEYMRAYGAPGAWKPVDAIALDRRLYVADAANGLIRVFDLAGGAEVKSFGSSGDPTQRLDRPTNLAVDTDGYLYVTDAARFQVVKFDRDGHFLATIGKPGDNLGHFARPKGLVVDREGKIYAVDAAFNNVQVFNSTGRLLMFFGGTGDAPGTLTLPAKVAIDYDNVDYFKRYADPSFEVEYLLLVTSQFGDRRVNVFGYGRQKGVDYPRDDELLRQIEQRRDKERGATPAP